MDHLFCYLRVGASVGDDLKSFRESPLWKPWYLRAAPTECTDGCALQSFLPR